LKLSNCRQIFEDLGDCLNIGNCQIEIVGLKLSSWNCQIEIVKLSSNLRRSGRLFQHWKNFKENCVRFATSHSGRTLLNSVQKKKKNFVKFGKLCRMLAVASCISYLLIAGLLSKICTLAVALGIFYPLTAQDRVFQ
jgi:hypothetical protein